MINENKILPRAMWIDDCQGKKDYDGPILSVSTRYWPGPGDGGAMTYDTRTCVFGTIAYGPRPSATSSIILHLGPQEEHDGGGDRLTWRKQDFEGDTEQAVKTAVETWVSAQIKDLVTLLGGLKAFAPDS